MAGLRSAIRISLACAAAASSGISCKSDSGSDVDFAYAFKYPGSYDYAYMDASSKLAKSKHTLDSTSSSVSQTLAQLHDSGVSFLIWNDQPPPHKESKAPMAHAKGVFIFNKDSGVWITHSLPHFPSKVSGSKSANMWANASSNFGQSFLCVTLSMAELDKLTPAFAITRPTVYDSQLDESEFPGLAKLVNKEWDDETMTAKVQITSKGGQEFILFGKSGNWGKGKDLYHFVGEELGDLYMEGWRRGRSPVWGPSCDKPNVLDISSVSFPGKGWKTTNDHSKWAITQSSEKPALCVGDLNRADGQDARGGGTVCIKDAYFHSQIAKVVDETDSCSAAILLV